MSKIKQILEYKKKVKEKLNKKKDTLEDKIKKSQKLGSKLDLKKVKTLKEDDEEFDLDLEHTKTKELSKKAYEEIIKEILAKKPIRKEEEKKKKTNLTNFYIYFGFVDIDEHGINQELARVLIMNENGDVELDQYITVSKQIFGYRKINEREYSLAQKIKKDKLIEKLNTYKNLLGYQPNILYLKNYKSLKKENMTLEEMAMLYFGYSLGGNSTPLEKMKIVQLLHKFNKF